MKRSGEYKRERREYQKLRRARLKQTGHCVNGSFHDPPVEGHTKCQKCIEVHAKSR